MSKEKIKNRDSDAQALAKEHKAGHDEGQGVKTGFGPWIFIFFTLALFLSPLGEKLVGYLKFRSTRTALQIKCDDRGNTDACIMLSKLYFLNDYKDESRKYQKKVCAKFNHLDFCKEKI